MKICVFGASSARIDEKYVAATERLGEMLAKRGHSLVFGAGGKGLMGASARGVKRAGGHIHGVVPEFFKDDRIEALYTECDELTYTETMRERKAVMEDDADAFIVVPGGFGTFEEMFEVITLKQLGRLDKPIAFYNIGGYYDALNEFITHALNEKFVTESCVKLYEVFSSPEEILTYLEHYVSGCVQLRNTKPAD